MELSNLKTLLAEIVHDTLYKNSKLTEKQNSSLLEIRNYLNNSKNFFDDLRVIISSRTNENYVSYDSYIKDFLIASSLDKKLEVLNNQSLYEDIVRDTNTYIDIWNSLSCDEKLDYLKKKLVLTDIDILCINDNVADSSTFKENIILKELLNNSGLRKKIFANSIELPYSYYLLSVINLNDCNCCAIFTRDSYTRLLQKKCKNFDEFVSLYNGNKKIYNLIQRNALVFDSSDNEAIYNFLLDNPNFIGKFNPRYLDLFSIVEINKISKFKNLDNEALCTIVQKLYKYNEQDAVKYFNVDSLRKYPKHSIAVYPFEYLDNELKKAIFNDYSLFNRFIDTIMIEVINNSFSEDDILNILRNDIFINDMSSYAIELLINKLSFKSAFNMLQRKIIFNKIKNLSVKIVNKDAIFLKGFLDSPILVYKSEHSMIYEMLNFLSHDEVLYYITLPYIIESLSNYEIINVIINKDLSIQTTINCQEIIDKLDNTDLIELINRYFEKTIDLTIFKNKELCIRIFNLSNELYEKINFDEVNYLFETIRMKSLLSKQETKVTVLTYKSILASYLVFGLDGTIKIVNEGNHNVTLDDVLALKTTIVNERLLMFKENNSAVFQNMAKKIISNILKLDCCDDVNSFAQQVRKNTYLDNIIFLMLDNNFSSYNDIVDKLFSYVNYYTYNEYAAKKEMYDYTQEFITVYLNNKAKEYNRDFEKVILSNFKPKENIIYCMRKDAGKEYIAKLKFKLFVRALTDSNKESYQIYFKDDYPINDLKSKYIKYLAKQEVDFDSILEHVLTPMMNERYDKENCLTKLGIIKPKNVDKYNKYLRDLESVTKLNIVIDKYKNKYSPEKIIEIMNYICYQNTLVNKYKKAEINGFNKLANLVSNLDGEIYVDKSALKYIYQNNIDVYNIEEIIEYNNFGAILDEIINKTKRYIDRYMDKTKIMNAFAQDYFRAVNKDDYNLPITPKYYDHKNRVLSLYDLEKIFNSYEFDNVKSLSENLSNFLFTKNNMIMVLEGYYEGIVDNLGLIIAKWNEIEDCTSKLDMNVQDLSLINMENILTIINFNENNLGKFIRKDVIKTIYNNTYYEVNNLNRRIDMLVDLFREGFKRVTSTIPYLCYKDDKYKVEILDNYDQDIYRCIDDSIYRVGSTGNDFLHYSILDKNGFQLGIYKDEVLVSKVLGIRNGNTIYLNALDGEKDSNYNELLRLFANELISITRDDTESIEYVTIVNNDKYMSRNGLKLDATVCPIINNPINTQYYDYDNFRRNENIINPDDIKTNYEDNISTLLASSKIVDKDNFKCYDAEAKYYRLRNSVIKLSNNIGEEYLNKIDLILYLCKLEDQNIDIEDVILSTMKNIYIGDDFVLFVTEKDNYIKFVLPYDKRANKEIDMIIQTMKED